MSAGAGMEDTMQDIYIKDMVRRLSPILKDKSRDERILKKCWRHKIALVWTTQQVHRAANEREVALTRREAVQVLQTLLHQHNPQLGLRWSDITGHIEENVLGRQLTRPEIKRFVEKDILTIHK